MQGLMLVAGRADLLPQFHSTLGVTFPDAFIDPVTEDSFAIAFSATSRLYVGYSGTDLEYIGWNEEERAFITALLPTSQHVYSLDYHDIVVVKQAVIALANSPQILVDNDCGTLLPGTDFVCKVMEQPDWYWFDDL